MIIMLSSFENRGYTYRLHREYGAGPDGALDIFDARYARGEIARDEYAHMKSEIARAPASATGR